MSVWRRDGTARMMVGKLYLRRLARRALLHSRYVFSFFLHFKAHHLNRVGAVKEINSLSYTVKHVSRRELQERGFRTQQNSIDLCKETAMKQSWNECKKEERRAACSY